jgi:hypothetical protein
MDSTVELPDSGQLHALINWYIDVGAIPGWTWDQLEQLGRLSGLTPWELCVTAGVFKVPKPKARPEKTLMWECRKRNRFPISASIIWVGMRNHYVQVMNDQLHGYGKIPPPPPQPSPYFENPQKPPQTHD